MTNRSDPVQIRGLNFSFGERESAKQILFNIDLDIAQGSLTALLGASGSGKTTLITLMGCLRRVQQGSIMLLGQELNGASEEVLMLFRRRLGFIFQAHYLHRHFSPTKFFCRYLTQEVFPLRLTNICL